MKKIFTLITLAAIALGASAEEQAGNIYKLASAEWGDVTWKNGNNKKDSLGNVMPFLMGTGNGYKEVWAEEILTDGEGTGTYRAYYTYINHEGGESAFPSYGLFYKFTPAVSGTLSVNVWVNKGNRKTYVISSDGSTYNTLTPYVDYTYSGYVNGQNNAETNNPRYFVADSILARHRAFNANLLAAEKDTLSDYIVDCGNQAFWGWVEIPVKAGLTYLVYQQTSQLGFGGYTFTDASGNVETYSAITTTVDGETTTYAPASPFAEAIDATTFVATTLTDGNSVVTGGTTNVSFSAYGSSVPTSVTPDLTDGIKDIQTVSADAPRYNLLGQPVGKNYKGIYIQNGVKKIAR